MNKNITISFILENEREKDKSFISNITQKLNDNGIKLNERQLYRYMSGEVIPKYRIARSILKLLKYTYSDEDVNQILINSENEQKDRFDVSLTNTNHLPKNVNESLHKRITLKNYDFTFLGEENDSRQYSLELIMQRVAAEFGSDNKAFKRYVVSLIDKDMKEQAAKKNHGEFFLQEITEGEKDEKEY